MNSLVQDKVRAFVSIAFSPGGWLVQRGLHYQPQQEAYAHDVVKWLLGAQERPAALLEGATGIGKSLGYLIPLLTWSTLTGARVGISTFTIHLQRQLLNGDIKIASDFLRSHSLPVPVVGHFLGRANYLNPRRIGALIDDRKLHGFDVDPDLINLHDWARQTVDCTLQGYLAEFEKLPEGVNPNDICMHANDEDAACSGFFLDRERVANAQVIITSHAVMILDALYSGRLISGDSSDSPPRMHAVIYDEADRLPTAAAFLDKRLQFTHVIFLLDRLLSDESIAENTYWQHSITKLKTLFDDLHVRLTSLGSELIPQSSLSAQEMDAATMDKISHASHGLRNLLNRLEGVAFSQSETRARYDELGSHAVWLTRYLAEIAVPDSDQFLGIFWSPVQRIPSLYEYRIDPHSILGRDLRAGKSHSDAPPYRRLFTSATLSDSGKSYAMRFQGFWSSLRIKSERVCVEAGYEPSVFGRLRFVLAAPNVSPPFGIEEEGDHRLQPAWLDYCTSMITRAALSGPVLVLAGSYDEVKLLSERLSVPHIGHLRGTKLSAAVATFLAQRSVLITPAAWEGLSLRNVDGTQFFEELVITRLPFAPTRTEELAAIRSILRRGRRPISAESITYVRRANEAKRKLRQGLGRGIRAADDSCRVWIADPRFPHPGCNGNFSGLITAIPERFQESYNAAEYFSSNGELCRCVEHHGMTREDIAMAYL